MKRRARHPAPDFAQYHGDWRRLAERTLALLDQADPVFADLRDLGDLAAMAFNTWTYPAEGPRGALARTLSVSALTWARQHTKAQRAPIAAGVRCFAEAVLQLLDALEAESPSTPGRPATLRYRADIDG